MADPHQNNPTPEEPEENTEFTFTDKRRIDPETGEVRDPVAEAEDIINQAAADAEADGETDAAEAVEDSEAEQLREDLQRLQAEFVNYRRRVERDRKVSADNATFSMMSSLLPVIDDLDAAAEHGDLADGPFAAIAKKLQNTLTLQGLVRHDQEALAGQEFDPAQHEAVMRQPSNEVPEDHIVQVLRIGYLVNDRVLRAAQVMVSAGPESEEN